jgi:hypothetical protein
VFSDTRYNRYKGNRPPELPHKEILKLLQIISAHIQEVLNCPKNLVISRDNPFIIIMMRAQWARTVLVIERSLPPSTRLRGQAAYSHNMADGRKALVLKKVFSVSYHS